MSVCRICKSDNLVSVLNLGEQYLSEFRDDDKKPPKFSLELVICNDCKQVQLRDTVPQNLLYTDNYGYRSGINKTMRDHLQSLVMDIMKRMGDKLNKHDLVADIGANDGTLLKFYPNYLYRVGYDLVSKFAKDYESTDIVFRNIPFGEAIEIYLNGKPMKFKIITAISMFYDLDDPVGFLQIVADNLDTGGIVVIQQNYLLEMLRVNGFDNVGFEHLTYNNLIGMQKMVNMVGLQIFDVQVNDLNGGSLRTYICHKGGYRVSNRVIKQLVKETSYGLDDLDTYKKFAERVHSQIEQIHNYLVGQRLLGKKIFICGASTRGNTLLQSCGITPELCPKAIERNPEKYGKKIASCGIPIVSEEDGLADNPDYLLVLPFFFKEEMCQRYAKYIKQGGKLIFPLPKLEVIG